ncbi:hypothetical protein [Vulgatibacter sp.]
METFTWVFALWILGLVAAQHLVSWLHATLLFGLISLASSVMRRDRLA